MSQPVSATGRLARNHRLWDPWKEPETTQSCPEGRREKSRLERDSCVEWPETARGSDPRHGGRPRLPGGTRSRLCPVGEAGVA